MNSISPKAARAKLDPAWYEILRQQVLRRDGWRCQSCGVMANLEVHHQRFRSHAGDDSEENLITLCVSCHEEMHSQRRDWSDVNLAHATVRVSHKPDRGWTPKAYKEREIPIPAKLVKKLKAWKVKSDKTCGLVFPTAGCNPKLDFLDCLKTCAERAKLDPQNFWLHKFRATFATRCLWAGVDLRTVQQWLGHSDMESTMRYLKPSRSQQTREKVNEIFA